MQNKIIFRRLKREEINKFIEIDRFEEIEEIYYHRDNQLVIEKESYKISQFDNVEEEYLAVLTDCYDSGGVLIGAFNEIGKLVGLGSVNGHPIQKMTNVLQLERLYISSNYRHQGIGKQILLLLQEEARKLGAKQLYVSSIPTKNSVDFYQSVGFQLTTPLKALFELEPEDIHMVLAL